MHKDLKSRIQRAAAAETPTLTDRFQHAREVVKARPTGYHGESGDGVFSPPIEGEGDQPKYMIIPVDQVDENPFNARRVYRQERVERMGLSIASQGQLQPAIATIRDGRYVLAGGHYRRRGIIFAGKPDIEIMLHPNLTDKQLYEISFEENNERDDQTPFDNALAWSDLLARNVYASADELALSVKQSKPNVSKTLAILKLPEDALEIVKQSPESFPLSVLYELVLLSSIVSLAETLEVAKLIAAEEIGRKEIQERREKAGKVRERKPKQNSRQYRIVAGDARIGTIRDFDDGRVSLDVNIPDPKKRMEIVEFLKGQFTIAAS